jgi:hypothetical protein
MLPESRQIIYAGINYHILPVPPIGQKTNLDFQRAILDLGVDITGGAVQENQIVIERQPPTPLQVRLISLAQGPQVGQILIVAPAMNRPFRQFINEGEAVLAAFQQTFQANRQILRSDLTLRCLYQATGVHAFAELWEERLHQSKNSLNKLGPRVLGGGLRFVIPPAQDDPEAAQIELKIESYLRNTKMIFVEVQFLWPQPAPLGAAFNMAQRLTLANNYIENQVHSFLMEDN